MLYICSMENYKQITDFPDYQVSDYGNIKGKSGKILKPASDQKGYLMVGLRKNGKTYTKRLARLVAIEFIPNPLNKAQVNHKDGNKFNNHKDNLEWNTGSENITHAYSQLKRKGSQIGKKNGLSPFSKKVVEYYEDGSHKVWDSMNDIAAFYNITRTTVLDYIKRDRKKKCKLNLKFYEDIFH